MRVGVHRIGEATDDDSARATATVTATIDESRYLVAEVTGYEGKGNGKAFCLTLETVPHIDGGLQIDHKNQEAIYS